MHTQLLIISDERTKDLQATLENLLDEGLAIVVDSIMYEEESFKLMVLLINITERLMAPIIEEYELDSLEEDIITYLDLRKKIHQEYPSMMGKAKPKHHYMIHYPEAVSKFGPVTAYWTAR